MVGEHNNFYRWKCLKTVLACIAAAIFYGVVRS
jgi:hypothetical protein